MFRTSILLTAALVGVSGWARADDAAKAVVEKAVKAQGGADVLKKYSGGEFKVEGTAVIEGESSKYTSVISYALPDKFRMTYDITWQKLPVAMVVIVNGDKVKHTVNGKSDVMKDKVRNEFKQLAANQQVSLLYPLLDAEFTLKSEKDEKVEGKDAAVVLVSKKGMKDVRLFLDKETWRVVKSSRKGLNLLGDEVEEETLNSEFKEFDGVMLPTVQKVKQAGKDYMTLKVTDVKLTEKPDLKPFTID